MKRTMNVGAMVICGAIGTAVPAWAQQATPVGAPTGGEVSQIQMRLHKDPDLKNNTIDVTVDNGMATLKGTVDTQAEKTQAARLALVSGIVGIDNRLEVGSVGVKQAVSDSAVTAKIKARLVENEMSRFNDVSVTTNNGVVTLNGSVPSEQAQKEVLQIARGADGVSRVENDLTIAPPKQR